MGSVEVHWSGHCTASTTRIQLCQQLRELAELSHSYFEDRPPITFFERTITGNIIVSDSVDDREKIDTQLMHVAERPRQESLLAGLELRPAGPQPKFVQVADDLWRIGAVDLYGIAFRLYDGRHLYDDDDRISFVFAGAQGAPKLDGRLVYVEDHDQCQYYANETVQNADWFLTQPHIHLRYYCEEWMDQLLAWVKYFYIPTLQYWRYEDLSGYDTWASVWDGLDRQVTQDGMFDFIQENFTQHVEDWRETATQVSEFWAAVRKTQ